MSSEAHFKWLPATCTWLDAGVCIKMNRKDIQKSRARAHGASRMGLGDFEPSPLLTVAGVPSLRYDSLCSCPRAVRCMPSSIAKLSPTQLAWQQPHTLQQESMTLPKVSVNSDRTTFQEISERSQNWAHTHWKYHQVNASMRILIKQGRGPRSSQPAFPLMAAAHNASPTPLSRVAPLGLYFLFFSVYLSF